MNLKDLRVMDGFMDSVVVPEGDAEEREAFMAYVRQFDEIAHELVRKLEPDRRDALCEQVVAMGLLAVHAGEGNMPEPVVEFICMIFNRCNISITDERGGNVTKVTGSEDGLKAGPSSPDARTASGYAEARGSETTPLGKEVVL